MSSEERRTAQLQSLDEVATTVHDRRRLLGPDPGDGHAMDLSCDGELFDEKTLDARRHNVSGAHGMSAGT